MRNRIMVCLGLVAVAVVPGLGDDAKPEKEKEKLVLTFPSNKAGDFELFNVGVDGKDPARLGKGEKGAMEPTWSPDGKKIAFVSFRTGKGQIFAADADGKEEKNLTNSEVYERNPAWSPDGKKILFTSQRDGNFEIYSMNADGSDPKDLTNDAAYDADPCWSPDGKRIAFASNRAGAFRLFVMNADGSDPKDLLERDLYGWLYPAWSPDGKTIAVGAPGGDGKVHIDLVSVDGGEKKTITDEGAVNSFAAWSPDGRYLAYVRFDEAPQSLAAGQEFDASSAGADLMLYDVKTEKHTKLSEGDLPAWGPRPAWKPLPRSK